jgi:hypothetical protein
MKVEVECDPSLDACTIRHEQVHLESSDDVAEWRRLVMGRLQAALGSRRAYLLVDYRGFNVNPIMADAYGEVAEEVRSRFAKDVFRYGVRDPLSSASARLQSLKRAHRSNVFATREEAIQALNKARGR